MVVAISPNEKAYDLAESGSVRMQVARPTWPLKLGAFLVLVIVILISVCLFLLWPKSPAEGEKYFVANLAFHCDHVLDQLKDSDIHVVRVIATDWQSGENNSWLIKPGEVFGNRLELTEAIQQHFAFPADVDRYVDTHLKPSELFDEFKKAQNSLLRILLDVANSMRDSSPISPDSENVDQVEGEEQIYSDSALNELREQPFDLGNDISDDGFHFLSDLSKAIDDGAILSVHIVPVGISETLTFGDTDLLNSTDVVVSNSDTSDATSNSAASTPVELTTNSQETISDQTEAARNESTETTEIEAAEITELTKISSSNGTFDVEPVTSGNNAAVSESESEAEGFFKKLSSRVKSVLRNLFK